MPAEIEGVIYLTATDLLEELGISRQTLWRWRQEGHIPPGYRFRDKLIVFTEEDAEMIRRYAFRLRPADAPSPRQMTLFSRRS